MEESSRAAAYWAKGGRGRTTSSAIPFVGRGVDISKSLDMDGSQYPTTNALMPLLWPPSVMIPTHECWEYEMGTRTGVRTTAALSGTRLSQEAGRRRTNGARIQEAKRNMSFGLVPNTLCTLCSTTAMLGTEGGG